jgi:hypothetical protein
VNVGDVEKSGHAMSERVLPVTPSLSRAIKPMPPGGSINRSTGTNHYAPLDYTEWARAPATKFGEAFRPGHHLW